MEKLRLMNGNNLELLKQLEDNSVDSVVTDPPYGLSFMNKKWDYDVPSVEFWKEVYRVLKPGGHVLSFGGTRTYHRMTVNIEDAGFEIRDQIMWLYGSGFPKSHNIGKAYDKKMGKGTSPYEGWGTALKPANEPICLARKPFKGTVVDNVIEWGTGGINVDSCRIGSEVLTHKGSGKSNIGHIGGSFEHGTKEGIQFKSEGRWPANIILDEEAGKILDEQSGESKSTKRRAELNKKGYKGDLFTPPNTDYRDDNTYSDKGGASRFFYSAKVSKKERNMGTEKNTHPTVKPVSLMTYLCRLITPKGGVVLDPFMGSGSTGISALLEDFRFIGMEMDEDYFKIAETRINNYEEYRQFIKK